MGVEFGVSKISLLCILSFVVGVVSFKYPSMVVDCVGRTHFDFLLYLAVVWVGNFTTPVKPKLVKVLMVYSN